MSKHFTNKIFSNLSANEFSELTLDIFQYQALNNSIYNKYLHYRNIDITSIHSIYDIPFLPIELFKSHKIITGDNPVECIFSSSGTTNQITSNHFVTDISIYIKSFATCFSQFYGNPEDYCILALLPSYLERSGSSLVFMAEKLIADSKNTNSGFFLHDYDKLAQILTNNEKNNQKTILLGVSYALLQFSEKYPLELRNTVVMETGGMKGKHKEITKEELHQILQSRFKLSSTHSEYGMTELLSQAYSKESGHFFCPPWMKILIRDTNDPFCFVEQGKAGGINVIDLANINSCCFIETSDLGRINNNGSFEVLGRFDTSDIRGCNLMFAV